MVLVVQMIATISMKLFFDEKNNRKDLVKNLESHLKKTNEFIKMATEVSHNLD
jgi:hypothetical protein